MLCHQGLDLLVDYDFVAIFDADFKPEPDFLVRLLLHAMVGSAVGQLCTFCVERACSLKVGL